MSLYKQVLCGSSCVSASRLCLSMFVETEWSICMYHAWLLLSYCALQCRKIHAILRTLLLCTLRSSLGFIFIFPGRVMASAITSKVSYVRI